MKRFLFLILLLAPSLCWAQFATTMDSSDVAGWNFTTFTDTDDSLKAGYQIYQKIDTTDAVIDSAVGAERAAVAVEADSALTFTHQGIKKYHTDTTSENFVFDGAYHKTSAETDSQFMSKKYIDDAAGGLVNQSVKGDHVDSTSEDFVFDGAYHKTSAEVDSQFMSKKYIDDTAGSLTEEEVEDFVGGMLGGTETNISVDYQDASNNIDFVVDSEPWDSLTAWANLVNDNRDSSTTFSPLVNEAFDSLTAWANKVNTVYDWGDHSGEGYITATLTEEEVEDYAGTMVDGGTETRISVTYTDGEVGAGVFNFIVDDMNDGDATESEIGDTIADHWSVFTAGGDPGAEIHDTTAAHWDEWVHVSGDAMTGNLTLDSGLYVGLSGGNTAAIHFFDVIGTPAMELVGYVGVGDDTPDFPFEIEFSYGAPQFVISESDEGPNIGIASSSGDLKFTASGGDVDFADDNVSTTGTFEAATITEGGTGVATNPDIHDSCDVLRAEMSDTARTAVGDSASLFLRLAGGTMTGNITMGDNLWLGLGSGAGRIEFDDQTIDEVNILGANVGIGTATPDEKLHITDNNAALKLEDDGGNDATINVGNSQLCLAIDPDNLVASSDICFDIDGDEVARLHQSTNFGIATMSPPERLSVVGNIATGDSTTGDTDVYHYFSTDNSWITEYLKWDDGNARFELSDDLYVGGTVLSADTLTKSFVIQAIDSDHDIKLWKTPVAITIDSVFGQCDGGTNVIGGLDEYDWDNTDLVAVVNADWTFTTTYQAIGSFTNAGIAAKNHVKWHTTSVSGTVDFFDLTIWYHED